MICLRSWRATRTIGALCVLITGGCASIETGEQAEVREDIDLLALSMRAVAEATSERVAALTPDLRRRYLRSYVTQEIEIASNSIEAQDANDELRAISLEVLVCESYREGESVEIGRDFLGRLGSALSHSGDAQHREMSLVGVLKEMGTRPSIDIAAPIDVWSDATCDVSEDAAINEHYGRGGLSESGLMSMFAEVGLVLRELLTPLLESVTDARKERRQIEEAVRVLENEDNRAAVDTALGRLGTWLESSQATGRARALLGVIRARNGLVVSVREAIDKHFGTLEVGPRGDGLACRAYADGVGNSSMFAICHDTIWKEAEVRVEGLLLAAREYDRFERESTLLLGAVYRLDELWRRFGDGAVVAAGDDDVEVLVLLLAGLLESVGRLREGVEAGERLGLAETVAEITSLLFGPNER